MIKFLNSDVVMQEIPDEISLAFSITNCPHKCDGCHTPELREDIGKELSVEVLEQYIENNSINGKLLISCILFLGGDHHPELVDLLKYCQSKGLKTALYTGAVSISTDIENTLDYLKIGQYDKSLGGLKSEETNQALYRLVKYFETSTDIPPEYVKIVDENFWDLIA